MKMDRVYYAVIMFLVTAACAYFAVCIFLWIVSAGIAIIEKFTKESTMGRYTLIAISGIIDIISILLILYGVGKIFEITNIVFLSAMGCI